jgi:hypothetical protein
MSEDNLDDTLEGLRQAFADHDAELAKMANECDPDVKLAVTKWVMKHIVEHAREGGSYRYLIYDRLGFGPEAYAPLCSDGLTISNEFDLDTVPQARAALAAGDHDELKKILSCCDEPGCYQEISAGWPSPDGYRSTCSKHYHEGNRKDE